MNYYELIRAVAFRIADPRQSAATGGSTTTLVADSLVEPGGYFDGGLLFLDTSTPQIVRIQTWDSANKTFTFAALSDPITAGTKFMATNAKYPLDVLQRSIWMAYQDVGRHMAVDTSIQTQAETRTYALPDGREDVRRVELLYSDGRAEIIRTWQLVENNLVFIKEPQAGLTVRLHYVKDATVPVNLTDMVDPYVSTELIVDVACMHALIWRNYKVGRDEPNTTEMLNYYIQVANANKYLRPRLLPRDPIMAVY